MRTPSPATTLQTRPKLPWSGRPLVRCLQSPFVPLLGRSLVLLRYPARSGQTIVLPVQARRLEVRVGRQAEKTWWRHFIGGAALKVCVAGQWRPATAEVAPYQPRTANQRRVLITLPAPVQHLRGRDLLLTWICAVAAAAAYLLGLLPSTLSDVSSHWPTWLVVSTLPLLGLMLLATIGTAQWLVLRGHVENAAGWIAAAAVAWTAALAVLLTVTTPLWRPNQPLPLTILIGLLGGLLMALTSASITGYALRRLLPTTNHR